VKIGFQRVGAGSVIKQRQRERLQIERANSFGVVWIQAMQHDTVLTEFATAPVQPLSLELGPCELADEMGYTRSLVHKTLANGESRGIAIAAT